MLRAPFYPSRKKIWASFQFETDAYTDHICRAWYNSSYTMTAKPIKMLELHYPMIQFSIIVYIRWCPPWRHTVVTSRRIFVSRQHSTESNFKFPSMTKALMKSCVFVVCKTLLLSVKLKPFLMQTEQQTQERRIVNPRRGRFDTEKFSGAKPTPTWNSTAQATKMDGDGSNKQRSRENITQWISNAKVL